MLGLFARLLAQQNVTVFPVSVKYLGFGRYTATVVAVAGLFCNACNVRNQALCRCKKSCNALLWEETSPNPFGSRYIDMLRVLWKVLREFLARRRVTSPTLTRLRCFLFWIRTRRISGTVGRPLSNLMQTLYGFEAASSTFERYKHSFANISRKLKKFESKTDENARNYNLSQRRPDCKVFTLWIPLE